MEQCSRTDPAEKEEDYRKDIAMLKDEIQELKNQKEEYNKTTVCNKRRNERAKRRQKESK